MHAASCRHPDNTRSQATLLPPTARRPRIGQLARRSASRMTIRRSGRRRANRSRPAGHPPISQADGVRARGTSSMRHRGRCRERTSRKARDFEPLISEDALYRVQRSPSGLLQNATPTKSPPRFSVFPREFVRCSSVIGSRPTGSGRKACASHPKWASQGAAGSGLQIALELDVGWLVREPVLHVSCRQGGSGCMWTLPSVMVLESPIAVRRETDVEAELAHS